MSYLDVPRLHFAGTFTADPSTINNIAQNYHATGNSPPRAIFPSWNLYGSASWTVDAKVTGYVDAGGQLHDSGPWIGATVKSVPGGAQQVPGKLVDLDVAQQARTQLFGLFLEITLPGANQALLRGYFDDGSRLINLWSGRVPSSSGDNVFGGAFQSVLTGLTIGDASSAGDAAELLGGDPQALSIRLSVYGYEDDNTSPAFTSGRIVGTIGIQGPDRPKHMAGARFLNPGRGSEMWYAPAKVIELAGGAAALTIDLGNSVPQQSGGGPPLDLGKMQAAILGDEPEIIGEIDYSQQRYLRTAGVAQLGLSSAQAQKIATNPIAILTTPGTQVMDGANLRQMPLVSLAESQDGVYVEVDLFSVRLNPDETRKVPLYARKFGQPLPNFTADLAFAATPNPANGVSFPPSVTTDAAGKAEIPVTGGSFTAADKPASRQNIDGQVYLITGPWASGADATARAPLSALVFQEVPSVSNPTWADVQPILYQYYVLYGYMAGIVNLSNYARVKANADSIRQVLTLPLSDAGHMPVSRDLSAARRKIVVDWIDAGCPAGPETEPEPARITRKAGPAAE